jgi:hypothetical protein
MFTYYHTISILLLVLFSLALKSFGLHVGYTELGRLHKILTPTEQQVQLLLVSYLRCNKELNENPLGQAGVDVRNYSH